MDLLKKANEAASSALATIEHKTAKALTKIDDAVGFMEEAIHDIEEVAGEILDGETHIIGDLLRRGLLEKPTKKTGHRQSDEDQSVKSGIVSVNTLTNKGPSADDSEKMMRDRASNAADVLRLRQLEKERLAAAELAFAPRRDAIDSLVLDVQLSSAKPKHMSFVVESAARRMAPTAATGIANYARGSMSSKAGTVNKMERKAIVELGGIEPLSDSLDEALGEYLCTCCADALANLAIDDNCRGAVGDSNAIENLVNILGNAAHPDADVSARQSALCEHAAACLRNLALDESNAKKMAVCGAIPALITLCNDGSPVTRGMSACCLACIAKFKDRCEQICDYGAAQPLIRMLEMEEEVCQLSSAGCLNELSRLRRNKFKISHNKGFETLIRVLARPRDPSIEGDFLLQMVQEKAMLILLNLVEDDKLHKKAVKLGVIATSIHQLEVGSSLGKEAAAWILCHLIKHVTEEQRVETAVPLADMIRGNQWSTKSASCKAIMQIFRTDDEKLMFIKKADGLKCLVDMLQEREPRLHENTLGAILALMENPEVPDMLLDEADLDVVPKLVRMIGAANLVVRKLTFGILKCLSIYDTVSVHAKIPLQHHYYIEHPPDEFMDFIHSFVTKRKERGYLSRVGKMSEKFTDEELNEYEALFTELDDDSSGSIDADEIGLLVEAMGGGKLSEDQLQEMINEVDMDGSGVIEWDEFLIIMWNLKTGKKTGLGGILGNALATGFKRSAVGKGFQKMGRFYNRKKIEMQELMDAELKEQREAEERARMADKYWEAEKLKRERLRNEQRLMNQAM